MPRALGGGGVLSPLSLVCFTSLCAPWCQEDPVRLLAAVRAGQTFSVRAVQLVVLSGVENRW